MAWGFIPFESHNDHHSLSLDNASSIVQYGTTYAICRQMSDVQQPDGHCRATNSTSDAHEKQPIASATATCKLIGLAYVGRQVTQSVERRNLEVEVQGSKSALGTSFWGRISI